MIIIDSETNLMMNEKACDMISYAMIAPLDNFKGQE